MPNQQPEPETISIWEYLGTTLHGLIGKTYSPVIAEHALHIVKTHANEVRAAGDWDPHHYRALKVIDLHAHTGHKISQQFLESPASMYEIPMDVKQALENGYLLIEPGILIYMVDNTPIGE